MTSQQPVTNTLTRADLLRHGASVGTALAFTGAAEAITLTSATAAPAGKGESTLMYLLELEHLQSAFYTEALKRASLTGEAMEFARVLLDHEQSHVAYLQKAIGVKAPKAATYDFGDATASRSSFLGAAVDLEETGLGAYTGAVIALEGVTLRDTAKIVSVEARHTAWARDLLGRDPAPDASDKPLTERAVRATVARAHFIKTP